MANSQLDVFNRAIALVGVGSAIQDPAENSPEAKACVLWYDHLMSMLLRAAPWPIAKETKYLALLAERAVGTWTEGQPPPGWLYTYALPANCVRPRYTLTYAPFELGVTSSDEPVLYSNEPQLILTYTRLQTRIDLWPDDMLLALEHLLAAYMANQLPADYQLALNLIQWAQQVAMTARSNSGNINNSQMDTYPDWITQRGYSLPASSARYIFPSSDLTLAGA